MVDKAVVAFSGGLDTTVVVKYLQEEYNLDVVTVTVDVGQNEDYKKIESKARNLNVKNHYNLDCKVEFVKDFVFPSIKANSLYQKKYCLATALTRPLIAKKLAHIAKKENANFIAHGCSGKGNDQVRFDITLQSESDLPIIAPIRDLNLNREKELQFAKKHGIKIDKLAKRFSIDQNLWGRSIEGGILEDPYNEPEDDLFLWTSTKYFPDEATHLEIEFKEGIPISANNEFREDPVQLIKYINEKAGSHGIGIIDHIEDRIIGIKSREIYENPAATCLIDAHLDIEKMAQTNHEVRFKAMVDDEWTRLVYSGLWDEPLKKNLDMFINSTQRNVTGFVKIKMYKGNLRIVGRKCKNSLYNKNMITYGNDSDFDQRVSSGFIKLWGMQSTEANKLQKNV